MKESNVRFFWITGVLAVTFVCALVYTCSQQVLRQSANDPQIQMAEDAALALLNGAPAAQVVGTTVMDAGGSLDPFVVVYDADGKAVAGSGMLNGTLPTLPSGVFDYTRAHLEDRVTWQPAEGDRFAAVITYYERSSNGVKTAGFVLAARSLRETELREEALMWRCAEAWVAAIVMGTLLIGFMNNKRPKV